MVYIYSQLTKAIRIGNLNTVKDIIAQGVSVNINDNEPIRMAATYGHFNIVKFLVEHGADVNASDTEALREASLNGYSDIIRYLIAHGANVYAWDDDALKDALLNRQFNAVHILLNVYYKDRHYNRTTFSASVLINNQKYIKQHIKYNIQMYSFGYAGNANQVISKLLIRNILLESSALNELASVPAVYRIIHDGKYSNRLRKLHCLYG